MSNRLTPADDSDLRSPFQMSEPASEISLLNSDQRSHQISGPGRIRMAISGTVLPTLALLFSSGGSPLLSHQWQSGKVDQYAGLLMEWPVYGPFLPLIAFSMAALLLWLIRDRMINKFFVRLGLYTGAILTLHFSLLVIAAGGVGWMLLAAIYGPIQWVVVFLLTYLLKNVRRFGIRHLLIATTATAVLIALGKLFYQELNPFGLLGGALIIGAASSPVLSVITMFRGSVAAMNAGQSRWPERSLAATLEIVLGWLGWCLCYVTAWKLAVDLMLVEYAKLPTTPPNCYVCCAAANGHRRLVGSRRVRGIAMPVNNQLRRLKFLEIALMMASPRLHCRLRTMYDVVGPWLAKHCHGNRWLADAAFLTLIPLEIIAVAVRWVGGFRHDQISKLYRS